MCPWSVGGGLQGEMQVSKSAESLFLTLKFLALASVSLKTTFLVPLLKLSLNKTKIAT